MRRPPFRRKTEYVVVRPIYHRMGDKVTVILPGESLPDYRTATLRRLHKRNRIGAKGTPWTEHMLKTWEETNTLKGSEAQPEKVRKGRKKKEPLINTRKQDLEK